jgi:hypothetical protein
MQQQKELVLRVIDAIAVTLHLPISCLRLSDSAFVFIAAEANTKESQTVVAIWLWRSAAISV